MIIQKVIKDIVWFWELLPCNIFHHFSFWSNANLHKLISLIIEKRYKQAINIYSYFVTTGGYQCSLYFYIFFSYFLASEMQHVNQMSLSSLRVKQNSSDKRLNS